MSHKEKVTLPYIPNDNTENKRSQRKYNLPVIGHFDDKSVLFESILEVEQYLKIPYTLIFECCIGKIYTAGGAIWEFEKGAHYIKYKAFYVNAKKTSFKKSVGFNG